MRTALLRGWELRRKRMLEAELWSTIGYSEESTVQSLPRSPLATDGELMVPLFFSFTCAFFFFRECRSILAFQVLNSFHSRWRVHTLLPLLRGCILGFLCVGHPLLINFWGVMLIENHKGCWCRSSFPDLLCCLWSDLALE